MRPWQAEDFANRIKFLTHSDVASLPSTADRVFLTIAVQNNGAALTQVQSTVPTTTLPTGVTLPYGQLSFRVTGIQPGSIGSMRIYIHADGTVDSYWKQDAAGVWSAFADDGNTGATYFADGFLLAIQDGGRGDQDGALNGIIVDPGGPARTMELLWLPMVININKAE